MSWIDIVWPMIGGVSLALGLIHLTIWFRQRSQPAQLMFSIAAGSVAFLAVFELLMMRAATPDRYAAVLRWAHVPVTLLVISLVAFVLLHFRAGRPWLGFTACVLRVGGLAANFMSGVNLNFEQVTALKWIDVWGQGLIAIPVGDPNPWMVLGQLSNLMFVLFLLDAIASVWRRGDPRDRPRVTLVCGSMAVFMVLASAWTALVVMDWVHGPLTINIAFIVVTMVMSYELGGDVIRAAQLARRLAISESNLLASVTDITERLRLQQESALQRDQLAHLSRVVLLGEMSGSLAHELNQPLTAILSNAQAALRFLKRDPPDLDEVHESLVQIVESDKRASEVIRRLRAMLRKDMVHYQQLAINDVVQDMLELIKSDMLNRNIAVTLDLGSGLPMISGDPVQLQQVLLNLVINACDAMEGVGAGCALAVRTLAAPGAAVEVAISDIGRGVPPDDLERIFSPFVTSKKEGMGLGLAISRSIIQAHRGTLWATNNEARGATLYFRLPAAASPAESVQGVAGRGSNIVR